VRPAGVRRTPGLWPTANIREELTVDERTISPAGDPFYAVFGHPEEQERPCACYDGWVTIGQTVVDPETGEETEEFALYLCRRCSDSR
jgi:hypothetical protein